jgi:hypothetical protein
MRLNLSIARSRRRKGRWLSATLLFAHRPVEGHPAGADRGYDAANFVEELRTLNVRPHVAQNVSRRRSITRLASYAASIRARRRIEEAFGWIKTIAGLRNAKLRGLAKVYWAFTFTAAAAYNLIRLPKLLGASV